jgi:hypothetical protein
MQLLDLFLAPVYLLVFYALLYLLRPWLTNSLTRKYYVPAFTVKVIGALALGLIYQFYYKGGDTYNFHENAQWIYKAFWDSPAKGIRLLLANGEFIPELHPYIERIYFYRDPSSYAVIRLAALFGIISFNNYSVIALFFAVIGFSGLWALFKVFTDLYPRYSRPFAYSILFVPSVFFWGSGLLKDTLSLAAVGWMVFCVHQVFYQKKGLILPSLIFLFSAYILYQIKIYILLALLPSLLLWVLLRYTRIIQIKVLRYGLTPLVLLLAALLGYYAVLKVGEENRRYNLEQISQTAEITARWLAYVSEQQGGSAYTLGDFDYSPAGMVRKALPAVNVTLFRPYLWEVRNPVMLLSALESLFFLLFTLYVLYVRGPGGFVYSIRKDPTVLFCLLFSLSFAFAVGITTYNFGSLVRYKIPLLPFYLCALVIILQPRSKSRRKSSRLASTEKLPETLARA